MTEEQKKGAIIQWLVQGDYTLTEAESDVNNAEIWSEGPITNIKYSNGVIDVIEFTENGIVVAY